ncbi:hypothetical protein M426DRAFT_70034 [Hypoxylon sp. CI-4A]|nr:hypothetical protein M426DRAFT_70034 [Hypoxylon sp. CI-4A]
MCTYYYLHYHHLAPCTREIEYVSYYSFCPNSTWEASDQTTMSFSGVGNAESSQQWIQQPCEALTFAPIEGLDYGNPCASSGCLISQQCSSGACRLEDLGGNWICCQCHRGGNTLRWCVQPMKKIPDALCYHAICQSCLPDMK